MRIYNYYRGLKKSRQLPVYHRTIKDGDIVIQKIPVDEEGNSKIPYDLAQSFHKILREKLPNNTVITTLMDIEVLNKID